MSLYVYNAPAAALSVVRCSNQTKALTILKAVASSTTKLSSISCPSSTGTHTWQSTTCSSGKVAMCVDCADPCGTLQCPALLQLNPCGVSGNAYGCAGLNSSVNAYRVFTAEYEPFSVPPTFQSIAIAPSRRSVVIQVGLQSIAKKSVDGTVYCGVFAAGVVPTSIAAIVVQNLAAVSVAGVAAITVSNLIPSSSYDVYSVAVSPLGATMALADVLLSKQSIRTACCRSVKVSMTVQTLYQFASSVNAVVVTLDAPPADALTISLRTQSATAATSSGSALVPVKIALTSATKATSYTNSITSDSSGILGLVSLTATLSGTSAADYVIVYAQRSNFTVIDLNTPPPVPQLISALFSVDGIHMSANFDSDTDKGAITSSSFVCSKLFSFVGVSNALCAWESSSSVRMSLGSTATISVGDTVTLAGGLVKSFCMSTTKVCATYPLMAKVSVLLQPPLVSAKPLVSFFAPSSIGSCDMYTLDLSSSTGGSGRNWKSITITVTSSGGDVSKVQAFLNTKYTISPPTPVPSGYFPEGISNIVISLCNFLGQCGQGSTTLTVTARYAIDTYKIIHSSASCAGFSAPNKSHTCFYLSQQSTSGSYSWRLVGNNNNSSAADTEC